MDLRPSTLAAPFNPAVQTLRNYAWWKFRRDLAAGLTVSVVELPQAMAYALVAGVPPEYGIYTSVLQGVIGALLSSSEHVTTGPTNTQSLLVASAVSRMTADPSRYLQLVFALTVLKGAIQLLFAAARMGTLVRFVSRSVIVGVASGAGLLIIAGQLGNALGLPPPTAQTASRLPGLIGKTADLASAAGDINWRAAAFAAAAIALVLAARAISRFVPGAFIAVVLAVAAVKLAGWGPAHLPLVGELPRGMPSFHVPHVSPRDYESLLAGALALAVIGMLESVAIAKAIAAHTGQRIDANQEFLAQGLKNFATGFFQCIPGSASFTRSALDHAAGAQTRFAAVMNALLVGILFWALGSQVRHLPLASLAGVLLVIGLGLVDWRYLLLAARTDRAEATVFLATLLATALAPLEYAIFIGVFLSIGLYLRKSSHLHVAEMRPAGGGKFAETPLTDRSGQQQVLFLQLEGNLFFAVADELQDYLARLVGGPVRVVILRLKRTHSIDVTVLEVLERFARELARRGGHLLLAGVRPELMRTLRGYGLVSLLGEQNVFVAGGGVFASATRALDRAQLLLGTSIDAEGVAQDDEPEGATYQI
jgi:SulP family sulfate permease